MIPNLKLRKTRRYSLLSFLFLSSRLICYPVTSSSYFLTAYKHTNPNPIGTTISTGKRQESLLSLSQSSATNRIGSSSARFSSYASISADPGSMERETQDPSKNPLNEKSCVLVVGASRGIGLEFVKQCLSKGIVSLFLSDE